MVERYMLRNVLKPLKEVKDELKQVKAKQQSINEVIG